ncbi:unnamed protein product [Amaranthus hypochondriacus]
MVANNNNMVLSGVIRAVDDDTCSASSHNSILGVGNQFATANNILMLEHVDNGKKIIDEGALEKGSGALNDEGPLVKEDRGATTVGSPKDNAKPLLFNIEVHNTGVRKKVKVKRRGTVEMPTSNPIVEAVDVNAPQCWVSGQETVMKRKLWAC